MKNSKGPDPPFAVLFTAATSSLSMCSVAEKKTFRRYCHLLSASLQNRSRERVCADSCCNIAIALIDSRKVDASNPDYFFKSSFIPRRRNDPANAPAMPVRNPSNDS